MLGLTLLARTDENAVIDSGEARMTRLMKTRVRVVALAAAGALLLVPAVGGKRQVPFSANLNGSVSDTPCGVLTLCLTGTDVGHATHLGRTTSTKTATI